MRRHRNIAKSFTGRGFDTCIYKYVINIHSNIFLVDALSSFVRVGRGNFRNHGNVRSLPPLEVLLVESGETQSHACVIDAALTSEN